MAKKNWTELKEFIKKDKQQMVKNFCERAILPEIMGLARSHINHKLPSLNYQEDTISRHSHHIKNFSSTGKNCRILNYLYFYVLSHREILFFMVKKIYSFTSFLSFIFYFFIPLKSIKREEINISFIWEKVWKDFCGMKFHYVFIIYFCAVFCLVLIVSQGFEKKSKKNHFIFNDFQKNPLNSLNYEFDSKKGPEFHQLYPPQILCLL